jgi:hypothetical protein
MRILIAKGKSTGARSSGATPVKLAELRLALADDWLTDRRNAKSACGMVRTIRRGMAERLRAIVQAALLVNSHFFSNYNCLVFVTSLSSFFSELRALTRRCDTFFITLFFVLANFKMWFELYLKT